MAQIAKKTKRYPSDLTDEVEGLASLMPLGIGAVRGRLFPGGDQRGLLSCALGVWLADAAEVGSKMSMVSPAQSTNTFSPPTWV